MKSYILTTKVTNGNSYKMYKLLNNNYSFIFQKEIFYLNLVYYEKKILKDCVLLFPYCISIVLLQIQQRRHGGPGQKTTRGLKEPGGYNGVAQGNVSSRTGQQWQA